MSYALLPSLGDVPLSTCKDANAHIARMATLPPFTVFCECNPGFIGTPIPDGPGCMKVPEGVPGSAMAALACKAAGGTVDAQGECSLPPQTTTPPPVIELPPTVVVGERPPAPPASAPPPPIQASAAEPSALGTVVAVGALGLLVLGAAVWSHRR